VVAAKLRDLLSSDGYGDRVNALAMAAQLAYLGGRVQNHQDFLEWLTGQLRFMEGVSEDRIARCSQSGEMSTCQ